jgi:hypothetical protein
MLPAWINQRRAMSGRPVNRVSINGHPCREQPHTSNIEKIKIMLKCPSNKIIYTVPLDHIPVLQNWSRVPRPEDSL